MCAGPAPGPAWRAWTWRQGGFLHASAIAWEETQLVAWDSGYGTPGVTEDSTSWRSTSAPSETSCAAWPPWAVRVTVVPADCDRRRDPGVCGRTAFSCPTVRAIRRPPAEYAVPTVQALIAEPDKPIFGICLGHQILVARARCEDHARCPLGHRGANHPVKDLATGKVEITSQNHGFVVVEESLPPQARGDATSRCSTAPTRACALKGRPVFSVQYHPEASPGPHDSHYLFRAFSSATLMPATRGAEARC